MATQDDDIERWLAELAGNGDASSAETRALRRAILRNAERRDADGERQLDSAASDEHAWQQLQFRLRREGILRGKMWVVGRVPMALAATVVLAVTVGIFSHQFSDRDLPIVENDVPVFRGEFTVLQVSSGSAARDAQRLAKAAAKVGGKPTIYRTTEGWTIDATLDTADVEVLSKELARFGVSLPSDYVGVVRINVVPRP